MKPMGKLTELFSALRCFFTSSHKRQLLKVSGWACLLSCLEMLLAAAVIPYVQCLGGACPETAHKLAGVLGWPAVQALSLGLIVLITMKLGVQALLTWEGSDLNQRVQRDTVIQLLEGYLHLNWTSFRSRHATHYFRRCATTAIDAAYVTQQCVTMISSVLLLLFLVGLMLWTYPVASIALATFAGLNIFTQRLVGNKQNRIAQERELALQRWSIGMTEAFALFREIRVYSLERFFLSQMDRSIKKLAYANQRLSFLPTLPRLILDFAIFSVLLIAVALWLVLQRPIGELAAPLIFYAVVARTIVPAMINLLSTRAVLSGAIINIQLVLDELTWAAAARCPKIGIATVPSERGRFALEDLTFRHEPGLPPVVFQSNFEVLHPSWVAVVGASGSGKSTLVELLCGIQAPQVGRVVHGWPDGTAPKVAYLPQHVALLDSTIAQNVIFGFDEGDTTRVDEALALACLDELVASRVNGCDAPAGADGALLSGGERQRLALARALYRNPDLLLIDEGTSGLDEQTEARLFARLRKQRPDMSVIYVTHRSCSLHFADKVVRLQGGTLVEIPGSWPNHE
ncbi:MAG: hypothetical protein RL211_1259 [Pseudomonadota bacterium]